MVVGVKKGGVEAEEQVEKEEKEGEVEEDVMVEVKKEEVEAEK